MVRWVVHAATALCRKKDITRYVWQKTGIIKSPDGGTINLTSSMIGAIHFPSTGVYFVVKRESLLMRALPWVKQQERLIEGHWNPQPHQLSCEALWAEQWPTTEILIVLHNFYYIFLVTASFLDLHTFIMMMKPFRKKYRNKLDRDYL